MYYLLRIHDYTVKLALFLNPSPFSQKNLEILNPAAFLCTNLDFF